MITRILTEPFLKLPIILDVRSPGEFAESHIPNALNFPVLSNEEFIEIGTLYKKNPFEARILGASFVSANIAKHLLTLKSLISPKSPFGIHCARGGLRSQSLALILDKIGYQVCLLEHGYKAYRAEVVRYLQSPLPHRFITLVGQTGSGKSTLLQSFSNALDLEQIAGHLGSSFGGILGEQPSPKMFSNLLFTRLRELENAPFVLVEGESKKIGNLVLPSMLYQSYQNAPKILIQTPLKERITRIVAQYGTISPIFFENAMRKIAPFMPKKFWLEARDFYYKKDLKAVAKILLIEYYDKVYKKETYTHAIPYAKALEEIPQFAKNYYQ